MKRRLAVVPSDPLQAYATKRIGARLEAYYNSAACSDEVFVLSPHERGRGRRFGMEVVPTAAEEFAGRLKELHIIDRDTLKKYQRMYWDLTDEVIHAAPSTTSLFKGISKSNYEGKYYQALKETKKLI
jgi:hypothetical protein